MLPWKGSVTSDSLSKESGQRRGGGSTQRRGQGWSRMRPPPSGLEDGLIGYRKDTASPESSPEVPARRPSQALVRKAEVPDRMLVTLSWLTDLSDPGEGGGHVTLRRGLGF